MNDELRDIIAAATKQPLKLIELRVLLAMAAGHFEIYDIQTFYGGPEKFQRKFVVEAMEAPIVKSSRSILMVLFKEPSIRGVKTSRKPLGIKTPPQYFLLHLYGTLGREMHPPVCEQTAAVNAYNFAYRHARNQRVALELMADALHYNREFLSGAGVTRPMQYFVSVLDGYLGCIPKMTKIERENELVIGKRLAYNPKTKQREIVKW